MKSNKLHLRWIVFFTISIAVINCYSTSYIVTFIGHGESTSLTSVIAQNTTKGYTVTISPGQTLTLTDAPVLVANSTTNESTIRDETNEKINLLNDFQGNSIVEFYAKKTGETNITVYSVDGRAVTHTRSQLSEGIYRYKLTLPRGVFIIKVNGNGYTYQSKLLSQSISNENPQINFVNTSLTSFVPQKTPQKVVSSTVLMNYTSGDRLFIRGYSNNMCTFVTDVISGNKTIDFNFINCQDADGNYYSTVTIGNQIWMAENLKTTKYADGSNIILRASKAEYLADPNRATTPICRYFKDDANTKFVYGMAYKKATIDYKDLAPTGWHVPSHLEWETLRDAISPDVTTRFNSMRKIGIPSEYWNLNGATNVSGFSAIGVGAFWSEWAISDKTASIFLASDQWANSPALNNWFFQIEDKPTGAVCDVLASSTPDFIVPIRCVKDQPNNYDVMKLGEIPIGLWVTPPTANQTSAEYAKIKACGMNFVNGFSWNENTNTKIINALNYCQENGLKFFANKSEVAIDINSYATTPNAALLTKFINNIAPYAGYPAFAGELLMDEPGKTLFNSIAAFTSAFQTAYPDKLWHLNLFPTYATGGIQTTTYEDYVNSWIATMSPKFISFDSYPLLANGSIITDYLYNLDIVRAKSRLNQIPFWSFIQTLSMTGPPAMREPSEVDIRWEVWTNLVFGSKGIQYFCYWTPNSSFGPALIDANGVKTARYDYVSKINRDINYVGKMLLECNAEGVIQTATSKYSMYAPLTSFGDITSVAGTTSLVGCFQSKRTNKKKVLITTQTPTTSAIVILNVTNNVSTIKTWINGVMSFQTAVNNKLTFNINAGEAVFVEF